MSKKTINIGDIFEVKLDPFSKKYFQFISLDLTQLNSDVIRCFKTKYSIDASPSIQDIIKDGIDFYAHCAIRDGEKLGYWQKYGNSKEVGILDMYFKDTNDYGELLVSNNWWVWKINHEQVNIGKLTEEYKDAEIGVVIPPKSIVYRMNTGFYNFVYPISYENENLS